MKFGKFSGYNHNPDWSPYFLNYRALEKVLERVKRQEAHEALYRDDEHVPETVELVKDNTKDIFQTVLDHELKKINKFYTTQEKHIMQRFYKLQSHQAAETEVSHRGSDRDSQIELDEDSESETDGLISGKKVEEKKARPSCFSVLMECISASSMKGSASEFTKHDVSSLFKDTDALRNYANLNYLAVRQILKKYYNAVESSERLTALQVALTEVASLPFRKQSIDTLPTLLADIEVLYAERFTGGNVHKAAKQLRPRRLSYRTLFSGGVMIGITLTLALALCILLFGFRAPVMSFPLMQYILPVYRALGLPIVFVWGWALLIIAWQKTNINYVYILQLDPSSIASYLDILTIASTFTVIWILSFALLIGSYRELLPSWLGMSSVSVTVWPTATVLLYILILCTPVNTFYWETRKGFLYTLLQNFIAPLGRLQFRDFLLGDFLTSLSGPLVDISFTICFVVSGEWVAMGNYIRNATEPAIVNTTFTSLDSPFLSEVTYDAPPPYKCACDRFKTMYLGTTVAFVPFVIRLMQCLKKYGETRNAFPHLVNAGKYGTGFLMVALATAHTVVYGDNATKEARAWVPLWCIYVSVRLINSVYSWIWDVTMDWGLFRRNPNNPCLRIDILVPANGVYWLIIVVDAMLRLFWFSQLWAYAFTDETSYTILGVLLEIFRRSFWSFFRVELEAVRNYEDYRTIDLPVPRLKSTFGEDGGDTPTTNRAAEKNIQQPQKSYLHPDKGVPTKRRRVSDPTSSRASASFTEDDPSSSMEKEKLKLRARAPTTAATIRGPGQGSLKYDTTKLKAIQIGGGASSSYSARGFAGNKDAHVPRSYQSPLLTALDDDEDN